VNVEDDSYTYINFERNSLPALHFASLLKEIGGEGFKDKGEGQYELSISAREFMRTKALPMLRYHLNAMVRDHGGYATHIGGSYYEMDEEYGIARFGVFEIQLNPYMEAGYLYDEVGGEIDYMDGYNLGEWEFEDVFCEATGGSELPEQGTPEYEQALTKIELWLEEEARPTQ
jgi:hypothetical protein